MASLARRLSFLVALVAALTVADGFASATAHPAHPTAPARATAVGIGEREFRLAVYRASAPAGVVRFNVTNYGEDKHDLVIRDRHGRKLATSGVVLSGGRIVVATHLRPGTYRLRCELADHARRGMRTTIRIVR